MAITRRKLANKRPKALFGADGALMAAAIGLQTANDTVNTIMQVKEAKDQAASIRNAAKSQADAIRNQATTQARAMDRTNENNNKLQEQLIESNKELNKDQVDTLRDINTNMLIAQGQQNTDDRREQAKLVLKRGGRVRHKLRNAPVNYFSNNGNMPFSITDGGFSNYIGSTPEGFDLYELIGDDHEHYHKTHNGKYKSGVGVKFVDNNGKQVTVEGEGNQRSSTGELMLITPNDAMFLSKHSIKGFNPTKAVFAGINPVNAFAIQESLKNGNKNPYKRRYIAANGLNIYEQQPNLTKDSINNISRALTTEDNNDILNYGYNVLDGQFNQTDLSRTNVIKAKKGCSLRRHKAGLGDWWKKQSTEQKLGWISAGTSALGALGGTIANIVGSSYLNDANNYRAEVLGGAYNDAGTIMADAYNRRRGISEDLINLEDYEAVPAVATIRSARVNKNAELTNLNRREASLRRQNNRNTLSSAKRFILDEALTDKINADRALVYQQQANEAEQIKQQNAQLLNAMSMQNAEQRNKAKQAYISARMDVAKYNNDIANENILGAAEATSNAALAVAGLQGDTSVANATNRANAVNNIANTWNNALQNHITNRFNLYGTLLGADNDVLQRLGFNSQIRNYNMPNIRSKAYNFKNVPAYSKPSIGSMNITPASLLRITW